MKSLHNQVIIKKQLEYTNCYTDLKDSLSREESRKLLLICLLNGKQKQRKGKTNFLKNLSSSAILFHSDIRIILNIDICNLKQYFNKNKANKLLNEKNLQIKNQHHKLEDMFVELQK